MKIILILYRAFTSLEKIDKTITFYENLTGEKCESRFKYEEKGLELARVGSVLIVAGSDENLKPFINTSVTFLVDSLEEYKTYLLENGAEILDGPKKVPTGFNMHVKHPDGLLVEYVEHVKN